MSVAVMASMSPYVGRAGQVPDGLDIDLYTWKEPPEFRNYQSNNPERSEL